MDAFFAGVAVGFAVILFHESRGAARKAVLKGPMAPTQELPGEPVISPCDSCLTSATSRPASTSTQRTSQIIQATPGVWMRQLPKRGAVVGS